MRRRFFHGARPATFFDTPSKPIDDQAVILDRADRAAVLFRVGASEAKSLALPFHISSRANASRDRDESFQVDSLRHPALPRPGFA